MDKTIVISGGCGFVGSHLAVGFREKHPACTVIALDNLKRRGSELNLLRLRQAGVSFRHGDIRIREDIEALGPFDLFIDASAEPSVVAGITDSLDYVISTNLGGTLHCLQAAKKYQAGFIFLSTSRVYPMTRLGSISYEETPTRLAPAGTTHLPGLSEKGIAEDFPLEGARSFYGATKLASELMIGEFHAMTGMKTVINRCGVIAGPRQMGKVDQGFVVHWIARHFWEKPLSYFGYGGGGKQVRDMLHVGDLFRLIDEQAGNMEKFNGGTFNVGGGLPGSVSLCELTEMCRAITGRRLEIGRVPENRVADIPWFVTDHSLITRLSGWEPRIRPTEIVSEIHDWIRSDPQPLFDLLINEQRS